MGGCADQSRHSRISLLPGIRRGSIASQFRSTLQAIEIKDERRDHAIAAHTEIRTYLEADSTLRDWDVETVF
jgi:hypothetical protein